MLFDRREIPHVFWPHFNILGLIRAYSTQNKFPPLLHLPCFLRLQLLLPAITTKRVSEHLTQTLHSLTFQINNPINLPDKKQTLNFIRLYQFDLIPWIIEFPQLEVVSQRGNCPPTTLCYLPIIPFILQNYVTHISDVESCHKRCSNLLFSPFRFRYYQKGKINEVEGEKKRQKF